MGLLQELLEAGDATDALAVDLEHDISLTETTSSGRASPLDVDDHDAGFHFIADIEASPKVAVQRLRRQTIEGRGARVVAPRDAPQIRWQLHERHALVELLAFSQETELHALTGTVRSNRVPELARALHGLAIDAENHVLAM